MLDNQHEGHISGISLIDINDQVMRYNQMIDAEVEKRIALRNRCQICHRNNCFHTLKPKYRVNCHIIMIDFIINICLAIAIIGIQVEANKYETDNINTIADLNVAEQKIYALCNSSCISYRSDHIYACNNSILEVNFGNINQICSDIVKLVCDDDCRRLLRQYIDVKSHMSIDEEGHIGTNYGLDRAAYSKRLNNLMWSMLFAFIGSFGLAVCCILMAKKIGPIVMFEFRLFV